jgi:hypothetical protein
VKDVRTRVKGQRRLTAGNSLYSDAIAVESNGCSVGGDGGELHETLEVVRSGPRVAWKERGKGHTKVGAPLGTRRQSRSKTGEHSNARRDPSVTARHAQIGETGGEAPGTPTYTNSPQRQRADGALLGGERARLTWTESLLQTPRWELPVCWVESDVGGMQVVDDRAWKVVAALEFGGYARIGLIGSFRVGRYAQPGGRRTCTTKKVNRATKVLTTTTRGRVRC